MAYLLTILALMGPLTAETLLDFGVKGKLYPIEEEPLADYIQQKLRRMPIQEVYAKQLEVRERIQRKLQEPTPVDGLRYATSNYSYHVYPQLVLKYDFVCPVTKKVFGKKGDTFNTLKDHTLQSTLLFLDGSHPKHVAWAQSKGLKAKWVLVKGKPIELMKAQKHPVYFDQQGVLSKKLNISEIPCEVMQEGENLRVNMEGMIND